MARTTAKEALERATQVNINTIDGKDVFDLMMPVGDDGGNHCSTCTCGNSGYITYTGWSIRVADEAEFRKMNNKQRLEYARHNQADLYWGW